MELADVTDSKSVGLIPRVGSSPTTGTTKEPSLVYQDKRGFFFAFVHKMEVEYSKII